MYSNKPINTPAAERSPAAKTLAVMSVVLAMMFAVRLVCAPDAVSREEGGVAASVDAGYAAVDGAVEADPVAACAASGSVSPHDGPVTSGFGARSDPFGGAESESHTGVDIGGEGSVRAWSGGTVEFVGRDDPGYGNYVVLRHSPRVTSLYAHLASVSCSAGETVAAGQTLGSAGASGRATAPHLHFELRLDSLPVDPLPYLPASE